MVLYILQYFKEGMDYIKLFKMMYFAQREYFAVNGLCIVEDTFNRWWTIFVKCNSSRPASMLIDDAKGSLVCGFERL